MSTCKSNFVVQTMELVVRRGEESSYLHNSIESLAALLLGSSSNTLLYPNSTASEYFPNENNENLIMGRGQ